MNKKFSTLVASVLLATAVGASAADVTPNFVESARPVSVGDYKEGVYYQLSDQSGDKVLVMEKGNDGKYYLQLRPYSEATLANSLWLIEPSTSSDVEGGLSFRFKNKRYGLYISYNPNDAYKGNAAGVSYLPGETSIWKWSASVLESKFKDGANLKAAFGSEKDSVVYLTENNDGTIAAVKEATSKYNNAGVTLTPKTAGAVYLGVDDLNSMLGMQDFVTGKLQLSFNPETTGENLFTKNKYKAVPAAGVNSYSQFHLANAQALENNWKNEVEEYEAAFEKLGASAAYNAAKTRVETANAALLPSDKRNALVEKKSKLESDLEAKELELKNAIENYKGDDEAVKNALNSFKLLLEDLDKAEGDMNANLSSLAFLEHGKNILLEQNVNNATSLLETMGEDFAKNYFGLKDLEAEYQAAKSNADEKWQKVVDDFNALIEDTDVEGLEALNESLSLYYANAEYLNNVNAQLGNSISILDIGAIEVKGDIAAVEGMSETLDIAAKIKTHTTILGKKVKYITVSDYSSFIANFTSLQMNMEEAMNEAIQTVSSDLNSKLDANIMTAATSFAEYVDANWALYPKVKAIVDLSNATFQQLATEMLTLQEVLKGDVETLEQVNKAISECEGKKEALASAYNAKLAERDAAVEELKTKYQSVNVGSIINVYEEELVIYNDLIATNASIANDDKNIAVYVESLEGFYYFQNIKMSLDAAIYWAGYWESNRENCEAEVNSWVSLAYGDPKDGAYKDYLMVDTAYMTEAAGKQYQGFAVKEFKSIEGVSVAAHDINGRINYQFRYWPSQDSLLIWSEGGAIKYQSTKYWVDMTPEEVREGQFGNLVKVQVLGDKREVTTERVEYVHDWDFDLTINTRIGFAYAETATPEQLAEGIYLIQKKDANGMYYVDEFLGGEMGLTAPKAQEFKHIPAAQWVVKAIANSTYNTILNRESAETLYVAGSTNGYLSNVQMYKIADNTYKTSTNDTIFVTNITEEVKGNETLGYVALPDDKNPDKDYVSYSLDYLNAVAEGLAQISVVEDEGKLTVAATTSPMYFTFETEVGDTTSYGATVAGEKQLKKVAYMIKAENNYNHAGTEDKYITLAVDGSYVLGAKKDAVKFWLKEFKQNASDVCYYALINTNGSKVSVQDYPAALLDEKLETATIDDAQERTSTFALTEKATPKYRRLGATVEGDGFEADKPANAKFYHVGYENVVLYENSANMGAGTSANPSKPTGVNFLGQFNANDMSKNASIYVDTAYVRNDTKRPQYLLALRPDHTPLLEPCPEDPTHPAHEIAQTKADYLVVLNDSVDNKDASEKMYQFQGYTRLAFVPATHRRDTLIIENSKFTATKDAAKDSIYLGKNEYNNATYQFLLAEESETYGDFFIEVAKKGWLKIHNEIPVIVDDITTADIFNINATTDAPTANEDVEVSEVSIIAANGSVIVKGAAGKTVAISNILGQTIANAVISSDNETIAVPAGIAVVAVEGEEAVKVVVK